MSVTVRACVSVRGNGETLYIPIVWEIKGIRERETLMGFG